MDLLKKPWFRIVLAGVILGGTWMLVFGPKLPAGDDQRIVITDNDINFILASWQKTWQRPPTKEELSNAISNYVRDEVLYKEALNRNFDENNAMVRRSLIMQMNMIAEGQGSSSDIDEESIAAYYELRKEKFMMPARVSFSQVYYKPENHGGSLDAYINSELMRLSTASEEEIQDAGDPIMLANNYSNQSEYEIASQFGESFAK
ncbi:MAG: peptidylprolyl isomerase, partial [Cyclobacteriaceae bacterium]